MSCGGAAYDESGKVLNANSARIQEILRDKRGVVTTEEARQLFHHISKNSVDAEIKAFTATADRPPSDQEKQEITQIAHSRAHMLLEEKVDAVAGARRNIAEGIATHRASLDAVVDNHPDLAAMMTKDEYANAVKSGMNDDALAGMQFRDSMVTPEYAEKFKSHGFANPEVDSLQLAAYHFNFAGAQAIEDARKLLVRDPDRKPGVPEQKAQQNARQEKTVSAVSQKVRDAHYALVRTDRAAEKARLDEADRVRLGVSAPRSAADTRARNKDRKRRRLDDKEREPVDRGAPPEPPHRSLTDRLLGRDGLEQPAQRDGGIPFDAYDLRFSGGQDGPDRR